MDFNKNYRKRWPYTMEVLLKNVGVYNNSFSLYVCLSDFHTCIKKYMRADVCETMTLERIFFSVFNNGLLGVNICHIQCKLSHVKIKCQKLIFLELFSLIEKTIILWLQVTQNHFWPFIYRWDSGY